MMFGRGRRRVIVRQYLKYFGRKRQEVYWLMVSRSHDDQFYTLDTRPCHLTEGHAAPDVTDVLDT